MVVLGMKKHVQMLHMGDILEYLNGPEKIIVLGMKIHV
jgi:hypothetical protein